MNTLRDTMDEGLTAAMNAYGRARGLPQLRWHLCSSAEISGVGRAQVVGQASAGDYPEEDVPDTVRAWADALEVELVAEPRSGTVEARGLFDGFDVEVWGVVDHESFKHPPVAETS